MSEFTGKVIVLTGANGGFGREYTRRFLAEGARLILTDINEEPLRAFAEETLSMHPGGTLLGVIRSDLSTIEGCNDLFRKCREITHEVDILVNNAGILTYGYFHETPVEAWSKVIHVNVMALMHLTSLFLPGMIESGKGQVVIMSSTAGFIPTSFETAYSVSKCAVRGFGMALSDEVNDLGIDVTIIYPLWSGTGILQSPSYGSKRGKKPSSPLVIDPAKIVRASVEGIRKRKLHVYADPVTKALWWIAKIWPIVGRQPVE